MPRNERSKTLLRALPSVLFLFALVGLFGPVAVHAQAPDDSVLVRVGVRTDKQVYEPGEAIRVTVTATNPLDRAVTLVFNSTLQADYGFDRAWQWSDHRGFGDAITYVTIKAHETWSFPTFTHQPADYFVPPGPHILRGIVTGYGEAHVPIDIGENTPPPIALHLTPELVPNPVPFGVPVEMFVTVTNLSNTAQTFGHSGCPVLFRVDQHYSPPVACPEYWREITLQSGESIRFGPPEFDYLTLGRTESGFVLTPGVHIVDFEVPGVGHTAARIQVMGGGGSIAGQVTGPDGQARGGALLQAIAFARSDGTPWNGGNYIHQTYADHLGRYRFDGLPSDLYYVNASYNGGKLVWYPGVDSQDHATPLAVAEGSSYDDIDFVLDSSGPPPPPTKHMSGVVRQNPPPESAICCPFPLGGAVVAAVPVFDAVTDTGWIHPDDPAGDTDPPRPGSGWSGYLPIQYAITDSMGNWSMPVPGGRYRFVAFSQGFRYQWWDHATQVDSAIVLTVNPFTREQSPSIEFDLDPLPHDGNAPPFALITGEVNGSIGGEHDVPPPNGEPRPLEHPTQIVPVEGADVVARPLVMDPRIAYFAEVQYPARTDADGRYRIELPADVPYIVQAWAAGWEPQYYDHVWSSEEARPVDVAPGHESPSINFDLYQGYKPPDLGVISGVVFRSSSDDVTNTGDPAVTYPVAGAVVRVRLNGPSFNGFDRLVMTGEDGAFRVDGLPLAEDGSLTYFVSAESEHDLPAYFPDATRWEEATPVAPAPRGQDSPVRIVLPPRGADGVYFVVGVVRGDLGTGVPPIEEQPWPGDDIAAGIADSSDVPWLPLVGAYLYLVPADDPSAGPVAAGVTSDNGTLVIPHLAAGRYKAYADIPGFRMGWFHGDSRAEAAVLTVGGGGEPLLIDIVLETSYPPPGTGGGGSEDAAPSMVIGLHNTPNPFRPQTTIQYRLMAPTDVSVHVYDLHGRLVRSLINSTRQPAGEQFLPWDGRDDSGVMAGGGVYFYRVWTPVETRTGKMVMVR
ncbi:MAG: BsuPI-related putative proteinase inhibitor [Candidatus Eisenbacteria bacterium]|nr:BsuPI-related putative proteinase inhibitor [Candidatus Eisenbacteria bacterium]